MDDNAYLQLLALLYGVGLPPVTDPLHVMAGGR